jgi:hypothetical protein
MRIPSTSYSETGHELLDDLSESRRRYRETVRSAHLIAIRRGLSTTLPASHRGGCSAAIAIYLAIAAQQAQPLERSPLAIGPA